MNGSTQFLKLINLAGYVYPYFAAADRKEVFRQTQLWSITNVLKMYLFSWSRIKGITSQKTHKSIPGAHENVHVFKVSER